MSVHLEAAERESLAFTGSPPRPLRVLYIIDSLFGAGGAELSLLRLLRFLPRDRFQCRVLTFQANASEMAFLDQFPCPVDYWPLNNIYDVTAVRVALRLCKLVRENRIDVVHTFFQTSDLWAGPIAKLCGVKALISSRRDMGILRKRHHRIGYRLLRGLFDQVQTVSEGVRQYTIVADRVDPACAITIHNGIDADPNILSDDVESMRRTLGFEPGTPIIASVGNWREVKGIDVLVRAAALVGKEAPEARFALAGRYSAPSQKAYTDKVQQLNRSLGGENRIRFLGLSDQVAALLKLSAVFVLPSRSEGLSNALLEAMQSGLPCVATSVGGNPEVVVEGETGFLVPPDDPETMAARILTLLRRPELRRRMGNASRERILSRFTSEKMASKVMANYDAVLCRNCKQ